MLVSTATLAGVQLAAGLAVGATTLELASCGVRDTLWIDHYVAALYLPPGAPIEAARDPAYAKAVRMHIVESRYLPERIPEKWRAALASELAREPMFRVRVAYRDLTDGDVVTIAYAPESGVTMLVNGSTVTRLPGHDAIAAILQAWGEGDPIAGRLRRLALQHPC